MTEYSATSRTTGPAPGRVVPVPAVVLQGPANSAPELIVGPFATMEDAQEWAGTHPRDGGYSVAQELTGVDEA
jgi:hypothetical protein